MEVSTSGSSITVEEMVDLLRPIGTVYKTKDSSFNPNSSWGGTWELLPEGYVLLSGSDSGSYIVGDDDSTSSGYKEYGENTHTLTIDEMPSHTHTNMYHTNSGGGWGYNFQSNGARSQRSESSGGIGDTGGGQAHSLMQKSVAVYSWIRTA